MSLSQLFSARERKQLIHAVCVVAGCAAYFLISYAVLGADPKLQTLAFLPGLVRLMIFAILSGSVIVLPVAAWVIVYNGAFFIRRIRAERTKRFDA